MKICFVHSGKTFTSWMECCAFFFRGQGFEVELLTPEDADRDEHQIEWRFMGTHRVKKKSNVLLIHEYTSTSVPPFARMKDFMKKVMNVRPDFRLFLNPYVEKRFSFRDGVPFGFRDMGVPTDWLHPTDEREKKYDFIYTGEIKSRKLDLMLNCFAGGPMKDCNLLIVSKGYDHLASKYSPHTNIRFIGPVVHEEIRNLLLQSRFGINFMPDEEPFNQQTSTKLLEYAACKLPVVTSDYHWMRNFQKEFGGTYFYLNDDCSNFNWKAVNELQYVFPDLSKWTWEHQLRSSGIADFIAKQFP